MLTDHHGQINISHKVLTMLCSHQMTYYLWSKRQTTSLQDMPSFTLTTHSPVFTSSTLNMALVLASQSRKVIFPIILIILDIEQTKGIKQGSWDSIHVVSVSLEEKKARYRVVSTVFLKMFSNNPSYGDLEIAGNLTRSVSIIHCFCH